MSGLVVVPAFAVAAAGTRESAGGCACSPAQAVRAVRAARNMRTRTGTVLVPGNVISLRTMAAIVRCPFRGVNEAYRSASSAQLADVIR